MNLSRALFVSALMLVLSACGQTPASSKTAAACQTRPSDARIATALGVANGGMQFLGASVSADCTTGIAVYQLSNEGFAHEKQMVGTDNGRWFFVNVVGFGGIQLTEIL